MSMRQDSTFDSIHKYIGSVIKAVPVLRVANGLDYKVTPDSTVIQVVLIFYEYLSGTGKYDKLLNTDIVTETGKSLVLMDLHKRIIDIVPGEEIVR